MKVSATLSTAIIPLSNFTIQEKKAVTSLSVGGAPNKSDNHTENTTLPSDKHTYEALKQHPTKRQSSVAYNNLKKIKALTVLGFL